MPIIGRFLPRLGPPAPARGPFSCSAGELVAVPREGAVLDSFAGGVTGVPWSPSLRGGLCLLCDFADQAICLREASAVRRCIEWRRVVEVGADDAAFYRRIEAGLERACRKALHRAEKLGQLVVVPGRGPKVGGLNSRGW
jgi:hypothetical protein